MARLWTQLAGGRGPGWQAGWTSDRALASRLGQWADVPRLEPKTREKCLALPLSPLNLLRRGTVVRFPPHVTTPGKVTTYCITPTWGNKTASLLFVTENKPGKLGVQCFHQFVPLEIWTVSNVQNVPIVDHLQSGHFEAYHLHGLDQTCWHAFAWGATAQIIILGTKQPGALNQDQSYNMINIIKGLKRPASQMMSLAYIWSFAQWCSWRQIVLQRCHRVCWLLIVRRLLPKLFLPTLPKLLQRCHDVCWLFIFRRLLPKLFFTGSYIFSDLKTIILLKTYLGLKLFLDPFWLFSMSMLGVGVVGSGRWEGSGKKDWLLHIGIIVIRDQVSHSCIHLTSSR